MNKSETAIFIEKVLKVEYDNLKNKLKFISTF